MAATARWAGPSNKGEMKCSEKHFLPQAELAL